jgi:hypothetical protein
MRAYSCLGGPKHHNPQQENNSIPRLFGRLKGKAILGGFSQSLYTSLFDKFTKFGLCLDLARIVTGFKPSRHQGQDPLNRSTLSWIFAVFELIG